MTWAPRSCDVCGVVFTPESYQTLRCSKACRKEAERIYHAARSRPDRAVPGHARKGHLRRKYGLSLEQYDAILSQQGGGCAICGGLNRGRNLEVDHDHSCCPGYTSCGQCVRGLLCGPCNKAIGQLGDDAARLRKAAEYLEAFHVVA